MENILNLPIVPCMLIRFNGCKMDKEKTSIDNEGTGTAPPQAQKLM